MVPTVANGKENKMAVDTIILKNGLYSTLPSASPALETVAGNKGEPLWVRDTHNLYIRDSDGKLKSPLPDIVGIATGVSGNFRTRVEAVTNGQVPSLADYFVLIQSPNDNTGTGYSYKRITINQILTNSGLAEDKLVKIRELDAAGGYLQDKLRAEATAFTNPVSLSSQNALGTEYLQITAYRANQGNPTQVGGVYIAPNTGLTYNSSTGELKGTIAQSEAGELGVAKFKGADFQIAIDGTVSAKTDRFVFANETDLTLQTVGGKLAYVTDLPTLESNITDKTLITKKYVVDKLSDFNRLIDFKQSVEFASSTAHANLSTLGESAPVYEGTAVSTGNRVLLFGLAQNLCGVYILRRDDTDNYYYEKSDDFPTDSTEAQAYTGSMFACTQANSVNKGVWMVYTSVYNSQYIFGRIKDEQQFVEGDAIEIIPDNVPSGTKYEINLLYNPNTLEIDVNSDLKVKLNPAGGITSDADGLKIIVVDGGTW